MAFKQYCHRAVVQPVVELQEQLAAVLSVELQDQLETSVQIRRSQKVYRSSLTNCSALLNASSFRQKSLNWQASLE